MKRAKRMWKDVAVAKRIRALRCGRGWTQVRLAMNSGVSLESVKLWERGRIPTAPLLARVAAALGTSTDYLITGEDGRGSPPEADKSGVGSPLEADKSGVGSSEKFGTQEIRNEAVRIEPGEA